MAILRYLGAAFFALYLYTTAVYLFNGYGLEAFLVGAFALVWVGWVAVLIGLPLFLATAWVLPHATTRFPNFPRAAVGIVVGYLIWAVPTALLLTFAVAVSDAPPGESVSSPLIGVVGGSILGLLGAFFGLVETLAASRTNWPDIPLTHQIRRQ